MEKPDIGVYGRGRVISGILLVVTLCHALPPVGNVQAAIPSEPSRGKLYRYGMSVYGRLNPCNSNALLVVPATCDTASILAHSDQILEAARRTLLSPNTVSLRVNNGMKAADIPAPAKVMWKPASYEVPCRSVNFPARLAAPPDVRLNAVSFAPRKGPDAKPFSLAAKDPLSGKNGETLDSMIVSMIVDEVKTHDLKRDSSMRLDLMWVMHRYPFSDNEESVFAAITDGFPGRNPKERIGHLIAWAREYKGGLYVADVLYHTAYYWYRKASYDVALAYVGQYLDEFKENADRVSILKAMCLAQKNDRKNALALLEKITQDYPDSPVAPQAVFLRGWIYLNDQKTAEAKAVFENLVAGCPDDAFGKKAKQILDSIGE